MWRKLFFITLFVLVLAFSGSVRAASIDINNPSFEYAPDGNKVPGHAGLGGVLAWEENGEGAGGWTGVDVMCPYANSNHCHRWPGPTDPCGTGTDVVYTYIQHDSGCNCYQILDMNNSDANAVITEGRRYTLRVDALVGARGESGNQLKAVLFYLAEPCEPDVNQIELASKVHTVLWIDRPTQVCKGTSILDSPGDCPDWNYDLRMDFVAGAEYDGNTLGIKFQAVGQAAGDYTFIDNVRLDWQWATQAFGPNPDDGAVDVPKDANLIWRPGLWTQDVNGHDVYFGSTYSEVDNATTASAEFKGSQDGNEFEPGTMVLGDTYYWRIDEVNENYTPGPVPVPPNNIWKGEVWSFTVAGRAKNPKPADAASDVPKNVILKWTRGVESLYHDVYFGSTDAEVASATTGSGEYKTRLNKGTEEYDAGTNENPTVAEQYFWRIDEVNSITVKGHIWDFTVADYILVDDFDFYANPTELRAVWKDSLSGHTGNGEAWVNKDANYVVDGNSMRLDYWNTSGPYYSEAMRSYSTGQDWSYSGNGVTALEIDWFGDINNVPDPPMYVKLSDGSTTVQVNPGPNDVTSETVQTWFIPLSDFNDGGVTLSSITAITLGIGDGKGEGGPPAENGTLYFDDIRLQPPGCYPDYSRPAADFTRDCRVDVNDLMVVVRDWCKQGKWGLPAPMIEYLFEEGSGTTVANTGSWGSAYDLTIGLDNLGSPEPNNDPCWYSDADPCRGWTLWFDGERGFHPGEDANGGDYLVIPPMNLNSNTVTMTAWLKPDGPQADGFTGLVHHTESGDAGCAGLSYASGGGFTYDGTIGYVWNDNSSKTWSFETGIYIPEQKWSMTALVLEPTQATMYIYDTNGTSDPCDDVLYQATNTLAHNAEEFDSKTFIACDARGQGGRFYSGQMDAVRIYGFSLTQAQLEDVIDDIPLTGDMFYPLSSAADLCVGDKSPTDPCAPVDDQVDFCDWSKFADEWLETQLWPLP